MRRPLRSVPWVKPPVDYRPGRRVSPKRIPGDWTWRPNKIERMEAWLNNHPVVESLLGIALVGGMLAALIYLALYVPEAGR